jgi:DNA invertase Pin-like site-specific DNA recombinase
MSDQRDLVASSGDVAWHRAKLTAAQVREIRRMVAEEPVSYAAIARRFGVSAPTISQIANYRTWRELDRR